MSEKGNRKFDKWKLLALWPEDGFSNAGCGIPQVSRASPAWPLGL